MQSIQQTKAKLTYETQPAKEITILYRDGASVDIPYKAELKGYDGELELVGE